MFGKKKKLIIKEESWKVYVDYDLLHQSSFTIYKFWYWLEHFTVINEMAKRSIEMTRHGLEIKINLLPINVNKSLFENQSIISIYGGR